MKDPSNPVCRTISTLLSRIGDKWTVLVVQTLGDGSKRFNELRREIPSVSQRMLTLTLRNLERDGLVNRTVTPTIPPRVDYELTELGQSLQKPICGLASWAMDNVGAIHEAQAGSTPSTTRPRRREPASDVRIGPIAEVSSGRIVVWMIMPIVLSMPASVPGNLVSISEYEAEDQKTSGTEIGPDSRLGSIAAEASGRRAVFLGDWRHSIEISLKAPAQGFTIRYALPDTADGKGQNSVAIIEAGGRQIASMALTSRFSVYYGAYPLTNNPAGADVRVRASGTRCACCCRNPFRRELGSRSIRQPVCQGSLLDLA